jgi:hypothetical protein
MFQEFRKSATGALDSAKLVFQREGTSESQEGGDEEEQQVDRLEELAEYCPKLTFQQRLMGFAISFSLGCTCCCLMGGGECRKCCNDEHLREFLCKSPS